MNAASLKPGLNVHRTIIDAIDRITRHLLIFTLKQVFLCQWLNKLAHTLRKKHETRIDKRQSGEKKAIG